VKRAARLLAAILHHDGVAVALSCAAVLGYLVLFFLWLRDAVAGR
jgi:hypothetical protein